LLEAGADPTPRDNSGLTPAELAEASGYMDVAQLLEDWARGSVSLVSRGVAKSGGREERKLVWVEVAEGGKRGLAAACPRCGAPREPGAKYCWRCGAKLD